MKEKSLNKQRHKMRVSPQANIYHSKKFEETYKQFLNEIEGAEEENYLELDKSAELAYLKNHRHRLREVFLAIPSSEGELNILDIGTTPFTFFVKKCYGHYGISTIDLTSLMAQRCEKNGITFREVNLLKGSVPFEDDLFDVVIFTEVFEHLFVKPSKIFKEISRILKKDGILIFGTPNVASLSNRVRFLFGINYQTPMEDMATTEWVHGYGHVREYTLKECVSILKESGFSIKEANFKMHWGRFDVYFELRRAEFIKRFPFLLTVAVYGLMCLIVPPFRSGIHIVCVNTKNNRSE